MDLMASTPRTTLDEDLLKFGLINESQATQLKEERESSSQSLTEEDDEEAQSEGCDKDHGDKDMDYKKDDDDDDDDDAKEEDVVTLGDLIDEMAEEDGSINSALQVIEHYVALTDEQLEDLTLEQAVGIMEAYGSLFDASLEEGSSKKRIAGRKSLKKARRKMRKNKRLGKVKKDTFKGAKKGLVKVGGKMMKAGAQAQKGFKALAKHKGVKASTRQAMRGRADAQKGQKRADRRNAFTGKSMAAGVEEYGDPIAEGNENLDNLLQSLGQLTAPLAVEQDTSMNDQIEYGFNQVRESASEIAERIAAEVRASEDVTEDSAIVQAGLYFEGLAHDADRQARAFKRGDLDENTAMGDLGVLHNDLKQGIEDLATVE